jgi:hypothetical protein
MFLAKVQEVHQTLEPPSEASGRSGRIWLGSSLPLNLLVFLKGASSFCTQFVYLQ